MGFENAAKGIKLVFIGELLALIAGVISAINDLASGWTQVILTIVIGVIYIIGDVYAVIGLVKAGRDDRVFAHAWQMLIVLVIFDLAVNLAYHTGVFGSQEGTLVIDCLVNTLSIIYIAGGIKRVYRQKHFSTRFITIAEALYIVAELFNITAYLWLPVYMDIFNAAEIVTTIVTYAILSIGLVGDIMYVCILGRASKRFLEP